ncbi:MAG TPA: EAL domain-containing protein [Pseudomonadales bacterium]|nr:EAL domain-containing protein [Pseudomonadales bacterium]
MLTTLGNKPQQPSLHLDFIESFLSSNGRSGLQQVDDVAKISVGQLRDVQLRSHYQPVYSFAHQRIVGFEALVRPGRAGGDAFSPEVLFGSASTLEDTVFLDRVCRTLHVRNFVRQAHDSGWLFLNINPMVTMHGREFGAFFGQLLARYGIPPHRIVIEILEGQITDEVRLAESVRYYRDMGCLVAIDDFGIGHSNFDRILRIAPHIVKLDRSIIEQAADNKTVQRVLPSLVSLIHEAGSLALVEGVETEEQALIAMQSEVDFVQGYYFARPHAMLPDLRFHPAIGKLFNRFLQDSQLEAVSTRRRLAVYTQAFFDAVMKMREGVVVDAALAPFLGLEQVKRCYFLDDGGVQIGSNFAASHATGDVDARFEPLNDARNAIWARRQYFQKAIAEPGRVHISKPYLSITGGSLCVTLSIATHQKDGLQVFCGDIDWVDS